jgi:hypothetical protein
MSRVRWLGDAAADQAAQVAQRFLDLIKSEQDAANFAGNVMQTGLAWERAWMKECLDQHQGSDGVGAAVVEYANGYYARDLAVHGRQEGVPAAPTAPTAPNATSSGGGSGTLDPAFGLLAIVALAIGIGVSIASGGKVGTRRNPAIRLSQGPQLLQVPRSALHAKLLDLQSTWRETLDNERAAELQQEMQVIHREIERRREYRRARRAR